MKKTQRPPTKKEGCFAQLIIAALIVLAILGIRSCFFGESEPKEEEKEIEVFKPSKQDAAVQSHLCVQAYLKSPGSADFPYQDDDAIDQINDSTFVIVSYVDSQNTYGALVRTYYKTTVVFDKNGKAECKDLKLEEH